jgi:hypothetical protein
MNSIATLTAPREFSLMPFWFWNDRLDQAELLRQIADFEAHGVYGFVIHPRVGLPRDIGWMSEALLGFMEFAIEEAARRGMRVILYDEGMYPSGSSSGQVVARDPSLACRCLALHDDGLPLPPDSHVVAQVNRSTGQRIMVIDRPSASFIRGLHYVDEAIATEDEPAAGDILNPRTSELVLELVYEKFFDRFGKHFGKTVIGIFTDEPGPLGRTRDQTIRPGTTGFVQDATARLGYDFTPCLPALWFDEPDAQKYRDDYDRAIRRRLEETWYRPLSQWCADHGVSLCGHPDRGDEIGVQKYFQVPGQDLVWRWVLPGESTAIEGPESTQAKGSSSAMIHSGRRRNSNEFCGAYGHETTFDEFKWLANWCLVRGVNLLIPHAFYYSIRGPRKDERPPQVGGVGCAWWGNFKPFADHCRLLSWLNTDSQHLCEIAILTAPDHCPWAAAKVCLQNQYDFNYLDMALLERNAIVDASGVHIAGMCYGTLILDHSIDSNMRLPAKLAPMVEAGRVVSFIPAGGVAPGASAPDAPSLLSFLHQAGASRPVTSFNHPSLRVRQVEKGVARYCLLFNEGSNSISGDLAAFLPRDSAAIHWIDTATGAASPACLPMQVRLGPHAIALLMVQTTSGMAKM